jgi:hypothetical protein
MGCGPSSVLLGGFCVGSGDSEVFRDHPLGSCVGSGAGAQGGLPRCVVTMLVATLADASCGFRPSKVYSCQRPGTERFTPVNALVLSRRVFGLRRVVRRRLRISVMFPGSINGELVGSPNCL